MAQLDKSLKRFIDLDVKIRNADEREQQLNETYSHYLDGKSVFTSTQAENVYTSKQAIEKHKAGVEQDQKEKDEVATVIKAYLEATNGIPISYLYPSGIQYPTYLFSLDEDDEVVYSLQ
jgi:hypothetical protein